MQHLWRKKLLEDKDNGSDEKKYCNHIEKMLLSYRAVGKSSKAKLVICGFSRENLRKCNTSLSKSKVLTLVLKVDN